VATSAENISSTNHLRATAEWSPEVKGALETWGDVTFDYESTDTSDHASAGA
jgi:ribulose 1,5-bisphosphate carboxylase large subunit-like protein